MKKNWKTTAGGIAAIITAAAGAAKLMLDGDPTTNPDWNIVMVAVFTGVALLKARDHDKSSEDCGIPKKK